MPQPSFFRGVPLGAVIANWTLHFIADPALRADYLRAIHEALVPGGCLILTDKTQQSAAVRSMKEPRNLSAEEVSAKELSLVGVLEPLPFQW
jgi:predicted methyltransferase